MIEALLVLPLIVFLLAIVVYMGISMQRLQRATIADRYESWRGAARAPGPATGITPGADLSEIDDTFFGDRNLRLGFEPSDFFPIEPSDELQIAAQALDTDAGRLSNAYFTDFPRGRSIRLVVTDTSDVPLWDRLFPGSLKHRHTVMDTDWRFFNHVVLGTNEWFDDRSRTVETILEPRNSGRSAPALPTMGPAQSVRETFYADFDRRLDPLVSNNALADRIQSFYTVYPTYRGPEVHTIWSPQGGWHR
ncbi:MAG: hypothetical protein AAFX76_10350 [Planctomycetota bacterium]